MIVAMLYRYYYIIVFKKHIKFKYVEKTSKKL